MTDAAYHHEHLRDELIDAGIKLLDTEGYDGFSLRKAAKACGVSHAAPYRHFHDKEELIVAIAARILHRFNDCLKDAIRQHPGDLPAQIREMGCAYVRFFLENPAYLRIIFFSNIAKRVDFRDMDGMDVLEKPEMTFYDAIYGFAAETETEGPARDALALGAWGLVHGITVLLVQGQFQTDGDPMQLVRDIIWNGTPLGIG